jgi:putative FmdB family regulatory protein
VEVPIFEYRCEKCGTEFEELVATSERDKPQTCPACGARKTKRLMSAFSAGGGTCSPSAPT